MTAQEKIETLCLEKCTFDDECDFCHDPSEGSYAFITGYEYRETEYYICGTCALNALASGEEHGADLRPNSTNLPF